MITFNLDRFAACAVFYFLCLVMGFVGASLFAAGQLSGAALVACAVWLVFELSRDVYRALARKGAR